MKKSIPFYVLAVLILVSISCGIQKTSPQENPSSPTPSPTKKVQSAVQLLKTNTPTPTPTAEPALSRPVLSTVDASQCDWTVPIDPTEFDFGGSMYLHIPKFHSTEVKLYGVDNFLETITAVGSKFSGADRYLGPRAFLSPNGEWVFFRTDWVPTDEDEDHPPILVTALDLSEIILIPWEDEWDVALNWWDDESIMLLPTEGGFDDIQLLHPFIEETAPFTVTKNSALTDLLNLWEVSHWRGEWGVGVAPNHEFTQTLRFASPVSEGLVQNNIEGGDELFSLSPPWVYSYYPILEGITLWSPDNQFVAVPLSNGEIQELFLIDSSGEAWQITHFQDMDFENITIYPGVWSHNGSQLAFDVSYTIAEAEVKNHIFILDLEKDEIRSMCANGKPVAYAPDDSYLAYYGYHPSSDVFTRILIIEPFTGEKWLLDETQNWHIIDWIE